MGKGLQDTLLNGISNEMVNYFTTVFLDDMLGMVDTESNCNLLIKAVVELFGILGLIFHPKKSVLIPQ